MNPKIVPLGVIVSAARSNRYIFLPLPVNGIRHLLEDVPALPVTFPDTSYHWPYPLGHAGFVIQGVFTVNE